MTHIPSDSGLFERLRSRWIDADFDRVLARWKDAVAHYEVLSREPGWVGIRTSLRDSCLRGTESVYCLFCGGAQGEAASRTEAFIRQYSASGRLLFFFCFSAEVFVAVRGEALVDRSVVLSPDQVAKLWAEAGMGDALKKSLVARVPRGMLMPYDITISARGPMFFGRTTELAKLSEEEQQSFAIVGPSRIGKTSLMKRYRDILTLKKDPAAGETFYVDFYECADKRADSLARRVAMAVDSGPRADRTTAHEFANFMKTQHFRFGRKPTLILDEVDEVCHTPFFRETLIFPARHDYCRVILIGRGELLRTVKEESTISRRLRIIRLRELDPESARQLFSAPMYELGFDFAALESTFGLVRRLTGGSPHLIQYYGQRLVELASEQGTRVITDQHVEQLKWDFNTASFFLGPLDELKTKQKTYALALALLKFHSPHQPVTPESILGMAERHHVELSHLEAIEVGDHLVVQNILAWLDGEGGVYRIANEALPEYAAKMGYLTRGLEEALRAIHGRYRKVG